MGGKSSFLCIRLNDETENYICYKISKLYFERAIGVKNTIDGKVVAKTSKGYFKLSDIVEKYIPEKNWNELSDALKLVNFTVKGNSVLVYDTTVAPTGTFSSLLGGSSNCLTVKSFNVFIADSTMDNIELEVL